MLYLTTNDQYEEEDDHKASTSLISYVSDASNGDHRTVAQRRSRTQEKNLKVVHGLMKFLCIYILDEWKYPDRHLSLQICLPSGLSVPTELEHHVSANQDEYVLLMPYSYNFRDPEVAFYGYLGGQNKIFGCIWKRMGKHAKMMARIISMGNFLRSDPTKELWIEMRIKLPYKNRYQLAGEEDGCDIFNGFNFVEYDNGKNAPPR